MAYYQPSKGNTIRANRGSHYNPFFEKMIDALATDGFDKDNKNNNREDNKTENKYKKMIGAKPVQNNNEKRDLKSIKPKKIVI